MSQYTEFSKMEKAALATERMEAMKIKNEAIRKRYEEVQADRIMAEKGNSAITSIKGHEKDTSKKLYSDKLISADQWKLERTRIEEERLARLQSGNFRREWDLDKFDSEVQPVKPSHDSKYCSCDLRKDNKKRESNYGKPDVIPEKCLRREMPRKNDPSFWSNKNLPKAQLGPKHKYDPHSVDVPKKSKGRGIRKINYSANETSSLAQQETQGYKDGSSPLLDREIPEDKTDTWDDYEASVSQRKHASGIWSDDSSDNSDKGKNAVKKWIDSLPECSHEWSDPEKDTGMQVKPEYDKPYYSSLHYKHGNNNDKRRAALDSSARWSAKRVNSQRYEEDNMWKSKNNPYQRCTTSSSFDFRRKNHQGYQSAATHSQGYKKPKPFTEPAHRSALSKTDHHTSKCEPYTTTSNEHTCEKTRASQVGKIPGKSDSFHLSELEKGDLKNMCNGNKKVVGHRNVTVNYSAHVNPYKKQKPFTEPTHRSILLKNDDTTSKHETYTTRNNEYSCEQTNTSHEIKIPVESGFYNSPLNNASYEKRVVTIENSVGFKTQERNTKIKVVKHFKTECAPCGNVTTESETMNNSPVDEIWGDYEQDVSSFFLKKSQAETENLEELPENLDIDVPNVCENGNVPPMSPPKENLMNISCTNSPMLEWCPQPEDGKDDAKKCDMQTSLKNKPDKIKRKAPFSTKQFSRDYANIADDILIYDDVDSNEGSWITTSSETSDAEKDLMETGNK